MGCCQALLEAAQPLNLTCRALIDSIRVAACGFPTWGTRSNLPIQQQQPRTARTCLITGLTLEGWASLDRLLDVASSATAAFATRGHIRTPHAKVLGTYLTSGSEAAGKLPWTAWEAAAPYTLR